MCQKRIGLRAETATGTHGGCLGRANPTYDTRLKKLEIGMTSTPSPPRRLLQSARAVLAGFVAVFVLSLGTDRVLHELRVFPPWGEPMRHVWIGAAIGLVLTAIGMIAAVNMDLGPIWYPIALMLTVLPCAWAGGALYRHFNPAMEG
jgi:hypothetical protein